MLLWIYFTQEGKFRQSGDDLTGESMGTTTPNRDHKGVVHNGVLVRSELHINTAQIISQAVAVAASRECLSVIGCVAYETSSCLTNAAHQHLRQCWRRCERQDRGCKHQALPQLASVMTLTRSSTGGRSAAAGGAGSGPAGIGAPTREKLGHGGGQAEAAEPCRRRWGLS